LVGSNEGTDYLKQRGYRIDSGFICKEFLNRKTLRPNSTSRALICGREDRPPCFHLLILAQVSRRVTVRLKTKRSGRESLLSRQK
jgi:hypothetical protein